MTLAVEARDLEFSYGERPVIDHLSLAVGAGEIVGVIGPNSAGKTTLLRLLSKVLLPRSGTIRLGDRDLAHFSREDVARAVAVVPQELTLAFPFTVRDFVLMGRYPHRPGSFFESADDLTATDAALERAGVSVLADAVMSELSGGERQLVLVARALAQGSAVLLLDEPNAHLDLRHQVELARLVQVLGRDHGRTIVLVSHDLNLVGELCDRVLLMSRGRRVAFGSPEQVLEKGQLEQVFGASVFVEASPKTGRPRVQVEWLDGEARR